MDHPKHVAELLERLSPENRDFQIRAIHTERAVRMLVGVMLFMFGLLGMWLEFSRPGSTDLAQYFFREMGQYFGRLAFFIVCGAAVLVGLGIGRSGIR